jgi:hypothetical protein
MKIRLLGTEFHVDRWTGGGTDGRTQFCEHA